MSLRWWSLMSRQPRAWCAGLLFFGLAGAATQTPAAPDLAACSAAVRQSAAEALQICRTEHDRALAAGHRRDAAIAQLERASAAVALTRYDDAAADIDAAERLLLPDIAWRDQHRIERQRGVLAYRRERLAEAALHFGKALDIARAHDDARRRRRAGTTWAMPIAASATMPRRCRRS